MDTGVVSYGVRIHLDPTAAPLRVGMTANVDIVTEIRDDILLVPNRFVRIDRTTGQTYVEKLLGGTAQSVEIQTGQRDEFYSEVMAGLEEGDTVVLIRESSAERLRGVMEMGPP
jgi:multidrug efflux pump subunit AcrA (membrane-fusion protein)